MRLPIEDDFLSADGDLSITSHEASGAVSFDNDTRHSIGAFVRLAKVAKQVLAGAVLGAAALGTAHAGDFFESRAFPPNKLIADGMVNQWTVDVVLDSLSPKVKNTIDKISIFSESHGETNHKEPGSHNPHMLVQLEKSKLTCTLRLQGMTEAINKMFRVNVSQLSAADANRMRKAIIDHEVSHCELHILDFEEIRKTQDMSSSLRMNVAQSFELLREDSNEPLVGPPGASVMFHYTGDLMNERGADARAVLLKAKEHLSGITRRSSSEEVSAAADRFQQDASLYHKLRQEELHGIQGKGVVRHDHDTTVVLEALNATIHKALKNPADFERWKEAHLSFDGMNQLAIDLAIGSVVRERKHILASQLNTEIAQVESGVAILSKEMEQLQNAIDGKTKVRDNALSQLKDMAAKQGLTWSKEAIEEAAMSAHFQIMEASKRKLGEDLDTQSREHQQLRPQLEQELSKRNPAIVHAMHAKTSQEDLFQLSGKRDLSAEKIKSLRSKHSELLTVKKSIESDFQMHLSPRFSENDQLKVNAALRTFDDFSAHARAQSGLSLTYTQKLLNDAEGNGHTNPLHKIMQVERHTHPKQRPAP